MTTDHTPPAQLHWDRFEGAFANAAPGRGAGGSPTVGVAWHRCDCCGRDFLVVAAIAEDGREVNVALPALQAADFAERSLSLVASMGAGCLKETVQ